MPVVHRHFLGRIKGLFLYEWDPPERPDWNKKTVLVTASEGFDASQVGSSAMPKRFVGDASVWVSNIAPRDGGLSCRIHVDWDDPIPIWVDVRVFDEEVTS